MSATVRVLADDLTGALDTAAEFVGLTGPVQAFWHGAIPQELPPNAALDSGSRELEYTGAAQVAAKLTPHLRTGRIAFKKIDSLMRGPTLVEVAACFRAGSWERAVLAPAFPYQGRVTRDGVQHARGHDGSWSAASGDLVAALRGLGVAARPGVPGTPLAAGLNVFDAETDADLDRVAALADSKPVLWVGAGGLAQALARRVPAPAGPPLPLPLLGLFGSDQQVTAAQLAACETDWLRRADGGPATAAAVTARLQAGGRVVVSLDLPDGLARDAAAGRIADEFGRMVRDLPPPGTLLVAGGETLRGLCLSLGARCLDIQGRIVPGLPRSVMRGGRWDGVTVVSKSGAFGAPTLLRDLLRGDRFDLERRA